MDVRLDHLCNGTAGRGTDLRALIGKHSDETPPLDTILAICTMWWIRDSYPSSVSALVSLHLERHPRLTARGRLDLGVP